MLDEMIERLVIDVVRDEGVKEWIYQQCEISGGVVRSGTYLSRTMDTVENRIADNHKKINELVKERNKHGSNIQ